MEAFYMGLKIGVCGLGSFGKQFVELFQAHPLVDEVTVADFHQDRVVEMAKTYGLKRTFNTLEEMLDSDLDAISLFTQRWLHAPQAIKALKAGKHVYSAVPAAITLEELQQLIDTVKETGLTYMLGETSYYRPDSLYCRERYAKGDFGRFVYGEGQYYHDMSHFYIPYLHSNGDEWKRVASFPPMLYSTHSVAHVLSTTFRRMTEVASFGFVDEHEDGIFKKELSQWGNVFSNETALFRTSDGGAARINEFRRYGGGESRMSILGTKAGYEEQPNYHPPIPHHGKPQVSCIWSEQAVTGDIRTESGELDYLKTHSAVRTHSEDVSFIWDTRGQVITPRNIGRLGKEYIGKYHLGVSPVHPVHRLPGEFIGLPNGHLGSHQFLVCDFVESVAADKLPPLNVWLAARLNAPGIVAHESSKRGGELLKIPDFGKPPENAAMLDNTYKLLD
jgi:predicted dehydrogenase